MSSREIATISIYPAPGKSHSSAEHLSALGAYTKSLLHALPQQERARHIVFANLKQHETTVFTDNEIEVREVWQKASIRFAWQIVRAIRAVPGLKLIHLQHEFNQFGGVLTVPMIPLLLWIVRFVLRKKIVITYHEVAGRDLLNPELAKNFNLPVPGSMARFLFRWYYRITSFAANELLVQHTTFIDILRDEMGITTSTHVLPHGADNRVALADRNASRQKYGISPDERVLLFFGTLDWRKGLDILIDAYNRLPPGYRLIIGGGKPVRIRHRPKYKSWFAEIVAKAGENNNITLIGFVPDEDIPMLFAASDLVTLPYVVPHAISAVLNYAAAYERPFIGSDAFTGIADARILFRPDAESLARKVRWCFDGHQQELLEYARTYKQENSWLRSAAILAERYERILGSNLPDRPGSNNLTNS